MSAFLKNQDMKKHVNEEVAEFLKFLQNSAKKCAQDYNMLSDDARLFTEVRKTKSHLNCQVIGNNSILRCIMILTKAYENVNIINLETKLYVGLLFIMCLNVRNTVPTPQNHVLYYIHVWLFSFNDSTTIFESYFSLTWMV